MPGPVAETTLPYIHDLQNSTQDYVIDYGGSLIKILYKPKNQSEKSGLSLAIFPHGDLEGLADFVKQNVATGPNTEGHLVQSTGVGIKKDGPRLEQLLGRKFQHYNELDTLTKGFKIAFPCLSDEELYWPLPKEAFNTAMCLVKQFGQMVMKIKEKQIIESEGSFALGDEKMEAMMKLDNDTLYEMYGSDTPDDQSIIIMCSSGLAAVKGNKSGYQNAGYSSSGGRTLMGLGSLLTRAKTYDELMDLASKGDNSKVDIFIKDLKGGDTEDFYGLFPDETNCFNFGHAYGKTIDDFTREDLAAAVVCLMCDNVASFALAAATEHNIKHVIFCGSIINHEVARKFITLSFLGNASMHDPSRTMRMCKLGPYMGAIGCWVYGQQQEKQQITDSDK